jgi:hypothetical protein
MKQLLSIDTNAKTVKGQKYGMRTAILYMAPNTVAGRGTVCAMSTIAQCEEPCLNTAGLGGVYNSIQLARIAKTTMFFDEFEEFMNTLVCNIAKHVSDCKKDGVTPLVRLNGTSDIMWEMKGFRINEKTKKYVARYHGLEVDGYHKNIFEVFPNVQFYDYTKIAVRFGSDLPSNYDLTFSYSGVAGYQKSVEFAKKHGARIAVVFRSQKTIPTEWMGMDVVGGDDSDIRHLDPQGVIVALYAKGKAKKDTSGFVVDAM